MKKSLLFLFLLFFIYSLPFSSPILVEPPTNSDMVSLTPDLQWSDPNAIYFTLTLSTQFNLSSPVNLNLSGPLTVNQYQISSNILQPFTTYYWEVTSYYSADAPVTSEIFSFTTVGTPQQEIGHVQDIINGLVSNNNLTGNQGNILNNKLQQASHQVDLGHNFVATVQMLLFKLRVFILSNSNLLDATDAQNLQSHADGIIGLINQGNSILPPLANFNAHTFDLLQNYPNPFNPSTNIEYTIPERSHVTLKIYDILGKEVTTLVDKMQDPGTYVSIWNAKNFSSGIYFYRLIAGNNVQTKRMVLNK